MQANACQAPAFLLWQNTRLGQSLKGSLASGLIERVDEICQQIILVFQTDRETH